MNRRFTIISAFAAAVFIFAGSLARAQVTMQKISEDRMRAAGIHMPYKFCGSVMTPAPEGYEAFYISHLGRHGSRYNTNSRELENLVKPLRKCDSAGILNDSGKELLRRLELLYQESLGRFGALSDRGAREHRQIADRMYRRYPEVFSDPQRKNVDATSSTSLRCVLSMANFAEALVKDDTTLTVSFSSDDRTKKYLMKNTGIGDIEDARREIMSPIRRAEFNPDRFFEAIATDQDKLREIIRDRRHFCKDLYVAGGIVSCVDLEDRADLYEFFTDEELYILAMLDSDDFYGDHANSKEFGKTRVAMADEVVEDIIIRADEAIGGDSSKAADIRFSHDWMISPLLALIGIEGMYDSYSFTEAGEHWMTSDYIPMAANLQLVFFRSDDSNEVLVKVLHNEKEVMLPGLKSHSGPYYRWSDMKPYLQDRIRQFTSASPEIS